MSQSKPNVVTRFAPSPTGFMHVGGVRTALYAWFFARKNNGRFILRIEDTDKEREVPGSVEHIIASLRWLGIEWDQGPYLQSEHLDLYKKYALKLIEEGYAYPDPYSEEETAEFRRKAEEEKRPFLFRDHRPEMPGEWDGTQPLRFKTPVIRRYEWEDAVRGTLSAGEEALDDFILIKGDGYPTYNFSHIVDDIEMGVTHVMRGEEFISSTPKFLSLYDALGVTPPIFATLPPILGESGTKKLSKRDGAKDILDYKKEGYLPDAFVNFLAFLGWNPGDDREVMSVEEIIENFSLERVQSGGARFDDVKLRWFNHEHIKKLSDEEFLTLLTVFMEEAGGTVPPYLPAILPILKGRSETLLDAYQSIAGGEFSFLLEAPSYEKELLLSGAKAESADVATHLEKVREFLHDIPKGNFASAYIKEIIFPYATEKGRSSVLWPLRVALSGKKESPDPFTLSEMLGKEESLARVEKALHILS